MKKIIKKIKTSPFLHRGFTLIEILVIFLVGSIVVSIGVNSVTSYNNSQIFKQSLTNIVSLLNNTKSRAISQVKPSQCGINTLVGFEVEIDIAGSSYRQNALCGASKILLSEKKLSTGVSFVSGSSDRIIYNVGRGTVSSPGSINVSGFGKASMIEVDTVGVVKITDGISVTPGLTQPPTSTPPAVTSPPSTIAGYTRYSDGTLSKSGPAGTTITVFAQGAAFASTFNLIAGTNGGNVSAPCSQNVIVLNSTSSASGQTGFISFTSGIANLSTGIWQICFREESGASVTSPVTFTVTSGGSTPPPAATSTPPTLPTATSTPSPPTATPTPTTGAIASTSISITSINPNPSTRSSAQSMTFVASVTGTNCTPVGVVDFYRNSEASRFTAGTLSNSTPATASGSYNSGAFTVGSHQIYARFVPNSGGCPAAQSSQVNLVVN